jgi:hypothetical protein
MYEISTTQITDDYMHNRWEHVKPYALMVLKPNRARGYLGDDPRPIVWEHGRRMMALQAAGIMPIVCPCSASNDVISGVSVFNTDPEEARAIMMDDPAVRAGIYIFEVHACRSWPGDALSS